MSISTLLAERGIDRVLIIDDGYDAVPKAADLANERAAWSNFIADLSLHEAAIAEAFPGYVEFETDDLVQSDAFVAALWGLRGKLAGNAWEDLFGQYERDENSDYAFLSQLEDRLAALGLAVQRAGRDTPIGDRKVPIVFVDLFLGSAQNEAAMGGSIKRIRELIGGRETDPPLVVLMSRSDRLDMNKDEFRRQTGLLGAMFRVSAKKVLLVDDTLPRILTRLAQHCEDGRKIASLLHVWDEGMAGARQRFMDEIRKLDLPDYAQIRDLLLAFEGQPLGSYLLDVFDRVLQYEIEASKPTIAAAHAVNDVDLSRYLAPHIAGSPDLQELVYRTIYQNPERLRVLATTTGLPLAFGDLLADCANMEEGRDVVGTNVFVVITPACDLGRASCKHVLLMAGTLKALKPSEWSYADDGLRTPIVILPGDRRYWISWDVKDLQIWTPAEVKQKLFPAGMLVPFLRFREGMALELQQKMLADLGRVGQLAPMPASFPIGVELHRVHADSKWTHVPLDALERDGGVCFVGRDTHSKPNIRLVLSEAACDEIMHYVTTMVANEVPENARAALSRLKAAADLAERLENGLDVTAAKPTYTKISTPRSDGEKTHCESIAHIARNPTSDLHPQAQKDGVIAFILRDLPQATPPKLLPIAIEQNEEKS